MLEPLQTQVHRHLTGLAKTKTTGPENNHCITTPPDDLIASPSPIDSAYLFRICDFPVQRVFSLPGE